MSKYTWINMGSSNGFLYDRTELLPKAIMTCHQVDPLTTVSMEDVTPLLTSWNCVFHELSHQYESNFARDASAISAKLAWKFLLWGLIICLITIIEVDGWRCLVVILMLQRPLLMTQTLVPTAMFINEKFKFQFIPYMNCFYLVRTYLLIWTKTIS